MDYRTKEMEQATADFVREAQDAIEKQDINSLAQLKQQYKMLWDQRVAERKVFDDDIKNYEAGKTVLAADPRLLMQAKTPEEAFHGLHFCLTLKCSRGHVMEHKNRQAFGFTTTKKKGVLQALNRPVQNPPL